MFIAFNNDWPLFVFAAVSCFIDIVKLLLHCQLVINYHRKEPKGIVFAHLIVFFQHYRMQDASKISQWKT